jgi:protein-tyrosine-phosphatase
MWMAGGQRVQSVLFLCSMNVIRSPMAEALAKDILKRSVYVQSAGVQKGVSDPFLTAILAEIGIDAANHKPHTLDELADWEGLAFDLIISLSPDAHHAALELTRTMAVDVRYWPTPDPSLTQGSREQKLSAYRDTRLHLERRLRDTFLYE